MTAERIVESVQVDTVGEASSAHLALGVVLLVVDREAAGYAKLCCGHEVGMYRRYLSMWCLTWGHATGVNQMVR